MNLATGLLHTAVLGGLILGLGVMDGFADRTLASRRLNPGVTLALAFRGKLIDQGLL